MDAADKVSGYACQVNSDVSGRSHTEKPLEVVTKYESEPVLGHRVSANRYPVPEDEAGKEKVVVADGEA